jgi:hypothetical protein
MVKCLNKGIRPRLSINGEKGRFNRVGLWDII